MTTGKSLKYSELLIAIDKVACALRKRGLQPNDTVIYVVSNHIEVPVMFFGVWAAGGINAGLTPNLFPGTISDFTYQFCFNQNNDDDLQLTLRQEQ